jgi:hypothetical protein
MNTAEMWVQAQNDGKTYECIDGDMAYSKNRGLIDKDDLSSPWNLDAWKDDKERGLDYLMNCEWQEMNRAMSIEEAEKKFGIIIIK